MTMGYKITNIEYGIGKWGTDFLYGFVGNPKPDETEDNVHSITLLQDGNLNILVDTGVDTENPEKDKLWKTLKQHMLGTVWALERVGLTPEDIDYVILTHSHIDHVGAIERFKNAKGIYLQKKDFEAWEKMATDPRYLQVTIPAILPEDFPPMREMIDAGQITLLDGDVDELLPGISVKVFENCHSVAEQVVLVDTDDGEYIIGGDIACRPANLVGTDRWKGFLAPLLGRSGSALNVYEAYEWILDRLNGDVQHLVLTHDTTMSDRFKSKPTQDGLSIHYIVD